LRQDVAPPSNNTRSVNLTGSVNIGSWDILSDVWKFTVGTEGPQMKTGVLNFGGQGIIGPNFNETTIIANFKSIVDFSNIKSSQPHVRLIDGHGTFNVGSKILVVGGSLSTTDGVFLIKGTDSGNLLKVGNGTLTVIGGLDIPTVISRGTLQLGSPITRGFPRTDFKITIQDQAVLAIYGSSGIGTQINAPITGEGSVQLLGGTLNFFARTTYTGDTLVNAGTLMASGANVFSQSSATTVNTNATLDLGGFAQTINSVMLAGGTIQKGQLTGAIGSTGGTVNNLAGPASLTTTSGTTTLTGNNTYTGGTTIRGGTLQLGNGGTTGSVVGNITNNGVLAFNRSATGGPPRFPGTGALMFGGMISGTGSVQQLGSGTTLLRGANTYTGATTVNAGTLQLVGPIASANIDVRNAARLLFGIGRSDGGPLNANIINSGEIIFQSSTSANTSTIANNGTLLFAETAGKSTITNSGALDFGVFGSAGSSTIVNKNGGTINFQLRSSGANATINNSGKVFFKDDSRSASVVLNNLSADAVVDLSSKVPKKPMSAASIAGAGTFFLGSSVFKVGSNNQDSTVTGAISDGGQFGGKDASFVKEGTGKLTLNGKNTWTGDTIVNGGKLVANGKELGPGRYGPPPEFRPAR
jgi:autotransporter-associated beta strand protein